MSTLKIILRIVALVVLLAASTIGYFYFSAWKKNERPDATDVRWENDEMVLGEQTTLYATIRAPWHRRPESIVPSRVPLGLVAPIEGGKITRGQLDIKGYRSWTLEIPMVPTSTEESESQLIEIPLNSTRRRSIMSAAIPAPPFTVSTPAEVPDSPLIETQPLKPDSLATEITQTVEESAPFPWFVLVIISAAIILSVYIIRYLRRPKPQPLPWETARAALDFLASHPPREHSIYYLQLTDILKRYTSDRFEVSADSASASELLRELSKLQDIAPEHKQPISDVIRLADAVKFAGSKTDDKARESALGRIRGFVESTAPQQEEANA